MRWHREGANNGMDHYYALFLAGGGGTRLWPMSRKTMPKQLLPLVGEQSMLQTSVERLLPLLPPERIYIVTGENYVAHMRQELPAVPAANFIVEPYGRDNAAATGLALTVIHRRDPAAVVAMLTADHHIARVDLFRQVLAQAHDIARQGYIVTLGISPTYPATGFGYIQTGARLGSAGGLSYHVATRFTEKPDVVKATQFIASGRYSWNSGMFIWQAEQALREFERQQPPMAALLRQLQPLVDTPAFAERLHAIWGDMPKKSIDFAIMEGAEKMAVIPVDIGWSDVGTWASLFDVLPQDNFGNCTRGKNAAGRVILDTHNTLVLSDRLVVTIGVDNVIVVETDDVLFVCHKDRTQDVKQIVDYLRENGLEDYL
ncbi:MAG: sugar phosphate nucleotidyltransferase [Anaerolineae bacterium]|jgi:mannose-1-phosphate guanylyltransferase|nr:sugar phosphate nucleotidyltransferase [Anaerolineae bacterium]